jgi:putative acetyltransferase
MSDIVIRHAEPKDADALRHHAQPEVYHDTLQVPHPSDGCGRSG